VLDGPNASSGGGAHESNVGGTICPSACAADGCTGQRLTADASGDVDWGGAVGVRRW
jgi:hypothetical protein